MLYRRRQYRQVRMAQMAAVWLIGMVCLGALVIGQVDRPAAEPKVLAPTDAGGSVTSGAVEAAPRASGDVMGQAIQSITFKKDMTITDALRFLAMKDQKNIVPTPRVEGMITVTNLYDVTFEEALQAVIGTNKYEVQGNFIMVYTPDEYEQVKADKRRMESHQFVLYYLSAEDAKKIVDPLLSKEGRAETTSKGQRGLPAAESIGTEVGADSLAFQDVLIVKDYPENIEEIERILQELDVRPQQVLIEATILSAALTEDFQMGIDLNLAAGVSLDKSTAAGWLNGGQNGTPIEVSGFTTSTSGLKIGVTAGDVSLFITALEQITDVTILANPKVLAVNKQVGQIRIGTSLPYREGGTETQGGGYQYGAVKFLQTGTSLAFRPYIGNDGYIRMDIHPKDSTGSLIDDTGGKMPQENKAEVRTNIIVKDGETIVIGGLFRDKISNTRNQVPLLGDIPVVGEMFKKTSDITNRDEVIILLTPHIIDDPAELKGEARAEDVKRKRYGAWQRLNWLTTTRLAEDSYARAVELFSQGDSHGALKELNWALHLRPTYLEALRLRERIVQYRGGAGDDVLERIMIETLEKEDRDKWDRL